MLYMNPASRVRFTALCQPLTFYSWHLLDNIGSELLGGSPVFICLPSIWKVLAHRFKDERMTWHAVAQLCPNESQEILLSASCR